MNPAILIITEASVARLQQARDPSERKIIQRDHIAAVSQTVAEMIFAAVGATTGLSRDDAMRAVNDTQFIAVNVAKQMLCTHGLGESEMTHVECGAIAEDAFKARFYAISDASTLGGVA